ncbi:MAG: PQQ-like beta-propeller repeat protein [Rubripirellula sp.]|nr:PQQ-like beta-propeller repeat protein [Rubripirellula sp.]
MKRYWFLLIFFYCFLMPLPNALAGEEDWPQWRGPNRDGHSPAKNLIKSWPESGPPVRWTFADAGIGYSTVAVVDGRLYTLGSSEGRCFAICLNLKDGALIWKTDFCRAGTSDDYNNGWGGGPRSTPTVDGDQVFVLSDIGVLACLDKASGKIRWKTDLVIDHGGKIPTWGYSDSALVDGARVVVTPGESKFLLAVDRDNGKEVWKSKGFNAGAQYVSIMKGKVDQTTFYLSASKTGMVAFDTQTGIELFADTASGNRIAVIPTPILHQNQIYHTSAYGAGNTLLNLSSAGQGSLKAESAYHLQGKTMENHHGGVVLVDGTIFGFSKANGGVWMAQDLETGSTLWEEKIRPNKSGSICYADQRLYCYNDKDGTVFLVEPSRSGWLKKGSLQLPRQTEIPRGKGAIWAHPVVAAQTLIIRDQDLIYAFEIAEK